MSAKPKQNLASSLRASRRNTEPVAGPWLNRETSILAFNRRVLAQSLLDDIPVLERLRYITIVSSNLDEFFEVRFADLLEQSRQENGAFRDQDLRNVASQAIALINEQYATFNDRVLPDLRKSGIDIVTHAERNPAQTEWVSRYFNEQVQPLLMPIGLDPSHPFPQVANKSLNFIVELKRGDRTTGVAIVRVPRALPRVIRLPDELRPGRQSFVLLSSVIRSHLHELFPGSDLGDFSQFRVTRDSDLDVDEDEVTNLRQALRSELTRRHYGRAIRLEVISSCATSLSTILQRHFDVPNAAVFRVNGPVNLVRLNELIDKAEGAPLRFQRFEPAWPVALQRSEPILDQIRRRDILLHHPFESFEPVIQLLQEAVGDPNVLAIKQTIYRTGGQSQLMELLIEAARRGKEVLAVVELKARFDEEANIDWADRLEAVGAQVVYGVVGLKTHAKMLLITRRERQKRSGGPLRHYLHLSTGNYNASTARLYTDMGFLTSDPGLTRDAQALFRHLSSLAALPPMKRLFVAPSDLHQYLIGMLAHVGQAAKHGLDARVVIKCNALTDPELMQGLVSAAQMGVEIDLIVRGACMLAPGVPGLTDRIRVRSVIGRFLEHSRIFYFRWGETPADETLLLSSADWMTRNMKRRIELAWPIEDPETRQRVIDEGLTPYLHDERGAWQLGPDGEYTAGNPRGLHAQWSLLQRHFPSSADSDPF